MLFNYLGRFDAGSSGDWQLASVNGQLGEQRDPRMRLPRALEFNAIAEPDATGAYTLVTAISWPDGMFTDTDITTLGAYYVEALTGWPPWRTAATRPATSTHCRSPRRTSTPWTARRCGTSSR